MATLASSVPFCAAVNASWRIAPSAVPIAADVVIAPARIAVYAFLFARGDIGSSLDGSAWPLVITGVLFAFAGVMAGRRFLHKVTMELVQTITGVMLAAIAVALAAGLI